MPILTLIISLGALKPNSWTLFLAGTLIAVAIAPALTLWLPRLYPWGNELTTTTPAADELFKDTGSAS